MAITEDRDKVRLLIGDNDSTDPILQDDEIAYFISNRTVTYTGGSSVNIVAAAADAAGAIAAEYARQFDFSEDGQSFSRSQRVAHYRQLERELRKRQGGVSALVGLGGTATT